MIWTGIVAVLALCARSWAISEADSLHGEAKALQDTLQRHYRHLHTIPELSFTEEKTSAYIRQELDRLGVKYEYPVAVTGIKATIGSGSPTVAIRADFDALPMQEETDLDWSSKHEGRMHACGHDVHASWLLGAAQLLKGREASLKGRVVLLFQPAEEGGAGGLKMVEEGALEGVSAVFGLHVNSAHPSGTVVSRAGTLLAACDDFEIAITGKGGHAAYPHDLVDPVIPAAELVGALQSLVSRETPPTDSAVISVSRFNTGEGANNVVVDTVRLSGTLRCLLNDRFNELRQRITEVVLATAKLHRCSATISWEKIPYIATVNDAKLVDFVEGVARDVGGPLESGGPRFVRTEHAELGGEDFGFMANVVPGAFAYIGIRNETAGSLHGEHTTKFRMDESALPLGAAMHAGMALGYLELLAAADSSGHSEL